MTRSDKCHSAAENAAMIAQQHYSRLLRRNNGTLDTNHLEEAREQTARDVYQALCRQFAGPPKHAIEDLVSECENYERNVRLTGYDPREDDPARDPRHPADVLAETMEQAIKELKRITTHQCVFHEEEENPNGPLLCSICGNDGLV